MSNRNRRTRKNRSRQTLIGLCITLTVVLAGLLAVAGMLTFAEQAGPTPFVKNNNIRKELTVEAGAVVSIAPEQFLKELNEDPVAYVQGLSAQELRTPGTYTVRFTWGEDSYEAAVVVRDTVAPRGTAQDRISTGEVPEAAEFVTDIQDVTEVTVTYKTTPDVSVSGTQDVVLVLTDTSGNTTELTAKLTTVLDEEAPQITGAADLTVYAGDAVSYRSGITVTDNYDEAPVLNVDSSQVDLSTPGLYTLVYSSTDKAGNVARVEVQVEVLERQPSYVDLDVIYEEVDKLLDEILTEGQTQRQQVETIYNWMRKNCWYADSDDHADYRQAAYLMIKNRSGDCFNYFGLSKLMFERLNIDNLDVRKVKNHDNDADHFWSLVSLDGGQTWYHFDATPRNGPGDDFCLVTDAFLDAYSAQHKNCHNRDKSLYPATPEQ